MPSKIKIRCSWANSSGLYSSYHDLEWGVAVHDDRLLFEMLNLEGAQAGLSWITILKKRDNYRKAFSNFDAKKVARFDAVKEAKLMQDTGIVRNRLKIHAVAENAKAFLNARKEFKSFDKFIWSFVGNKIIPFKERKRAIKISEVMSKDLKKRGFRFVGPTISYAFMQAVGMVDDHERNCFRAKKRQPEVLLKFD